MASSGGRLFLRSAGDQTHTFPGDRFRYRVQPEPLGTTSKGRRGRTEPKGRPP
ncbi:hypothetical protein Ctob_016527 [Chrysochromulina tobinii]|uniref:Uncharacterized protein n=1 Tax=Chrysochromulina tobinii TaxID=1460289 RepID=A0A0M0K842_9EUKA|nr:hypothetical protein Ctob_016527 [Chrysochromulina tobinii]|eukprot:KOO34558.1 hypothetical protein Ctob_016527 [Chrysochromulina sp. CCMP291]